MDDPKLKNMRRPRSIKGYNHKTGEVNSQGQSSKLEPCPCGGKPQAVSPRLAARIAAFDPGNASAGLKKHKPGSQNRKK